MPSGRRRRRSGSPARPPRKAPGRAPKSAPAPSRRQRCSRTRAFLKLYLILTFCNVCFPYSFFISAGRMEIQKPCCGIPQFGRYAAAKRDISRFARCDMIFALVREANISRDAVTYRTPRAYIACPKGKYRCRLSFGTVGYGVLLCFSKTFLQNIKNTLDKFRLL